MLAFSVRMPYKSKIQGNVGHVASFSKMSWAGALLLWKYIFCWLAPAKYILSVKLSNPLETSY